MAFTFYETEAAYSGPPGPCGWRGTVWADDGRKREAVFTSRLHGDEAGALEECDGWKRARAQEREAARDRARAARGAGS